MNNDFNSHFSIKHIQMANKRMKRWLIWLVIKEMLRKNKMRCHFTLIRMAIIKKQKRNFVKDVEKLKPSCIANRNIKWFNYKENSVAISETA